MTRTDDLLRDLTSDVDDPTPLAEARIRAEVMRRVAPEQRRAWRRPRRLVPLGVTGAVAAVAAAALVVNTGGSGPSLVQRAEAAVTPPGEIVAITARFGASEGMSSGVAMRDWTLAGGDGSLRMRRFISTLPPDRPPDDEDSVVEIDAKGHIVKAVSWTPIDRLSLGIERTSEPWANSWAGILGNAYRTGALHDAGTENGVRVLAGQLPNLNEEITPGCTAEQRVGLDGASFEPRWLATVTTCDGKAPAETARITFTVDRLPASPENLKLLRIGPWPVREAVRLDPDTLKETPVPVAEAKREAGMD
ncbi:MAG: hypothetical protein U0237_06175 [Thermoleophilia bacterium]